MKAKGFVKRSMTFMLIAAAALLVSAGFANAADSIPLYASPPATMYYTTNGNDPLTITTSPTLANPATLSPMNQINPSIKQLSPSYPATTAPSATVQHSEYINGVPVITPKNKNNSKQVRTAPLSSGQAIGKEKLHPPPKSIDSAKIEGLNGNNAIPTGKLKPYVSQKKKQPQIKQEQQP